MAQISGGRLAAAVTGAGGLGLIAGGYGDAEWLQREFDLADEARVGCGFITWSLARRPEVLDLALQRHPAAIMLSFGDPAGFAERIREAGAPLICQVQTLAQARRALEVGADIVVAQGSEAGGHGMTGRSTITLVPEVVDFVAERSPETLVLAAGGISDGRGVAAAVVLGADGVVVGTRFWASARRWSRPERTSAACGPAGTTRLELASMTLCVNLIGRKNSTSGRWSTRSSKPGTATKRNCQRSCPRRWRPSAKLSPPKISMSRTSSSAKPWA
jgi:nitronate monooxygenase